MSCASKIASEKFKRGDFATSRALINATLFDSAMIESRVATLK